MARLRTERGLDRLVNFSDAAVAIAITLLILPLVDLAGEIDADESFGEFFAAHVGAFIAFFVTFAVIGRFWMAHHRVFEYVATYSTSLVWLNLLWLASIVFLPFPANAVAQLSRESGSFYALYIGTMLAGTLSMVGIELLLLRRPELLRDDSRRAIDLTTGIAMTCTLLVAAVLAFLVPQVGLLWLLLLFLTRPIRVLLGRAFPALRVPG
jgi:uncharacterized membrane protein